MSGPKRQDASPESPSPMARPATPELVNAIQAVFDRWDVDRSGLLSLDEFRRGIQEEARSPEFRNDPTVRLVVSAVTAARGEASPLVA